MKRLALALPIALLALACHREPAASAPPKPPGNADRGKQLITQYGCNVCHVTPGLTGPQGIMGPSLAGLASRPMLSNNTFANTPANVAQFIQTPASMNPASAMPPLGIGPVDAQDIAAYLATLK
jgi:cytochrome c2